MPTRRQDLWYIAATANTPIGSAHGDHRPSVEVYGAQCRDWWWLDLSAPPMAAAALPHEGR
jgi:hypothetical protein